MLALATTRTVWEQSSVYLAVLTVVRFEFVWSLCARILFKYYSPGHATKLAIAPFTAASNRSSCWLVCLTTFLTATESAFLTQSTGWFPTWVVFISVLLGFFGCACRGIDCIESWSFSSARNMGFWHCSEGLGSGTRRACVEWSDLTCLFQWLRSCKYTMFIASTLQCVNPDSIRNYVPVQMPSCAWAWAFTAATCWLDASEVPWKWSPGLRSCDGFRSWTDAVFKSMQNQTNWWVELNHPERYHNIPLVIFKHICNCRFAAAWCPCR